MKNNNFILFFYALFTLLCPCNVNAQYGNLAKNPPFKSPQSLTYPNSFAQFQVFISDWESDEKIKYKGMDDDKIKDEIHLHSLDWFKSKYNYYSLEEINQNGQNRTFAVVYSEDGYVGTGDAELIEQQKQINELKKQNEAILKSLNTLRN